MSNNGEDQFEAMPYCVNGYGMWRKQESSHGGYTYWTDACGVLSCEWDDGISDPLFMFQVLDSKGELEMWAAKYVELKAKQLQLKEQ